MSEIPVVPRGYRIERLLGHGRTGSVYLAQQLVPHRWVAVKVVAPSLAARPGFRERFLDDCEIVAGLDHPSILPVYDWGEADGLLYVAMQCVDGADLGTVLREGPLSEEQTVAIAEQVGGALHAAHCEGVVHRDLEPANVFLEAATHRAFVADFGLDGPPGDCAAPERAAGKRLDGRADVYSLGCVVVKCLAENVPADLKRVVAQAQSADPSERHTTAVELAEALRRALPLTKPALPFVPEEAPQQRRRRLGWKPAVGRRRSSSQPSPAGCSRRPRVDTSRALPSTGASGRPCAGRCLPSPRRSCTSPPCPARPTPAPPLYDRVAHTGGVGVRYRSTPDRWCGGARPQTDPCWHDVVPGTGAAEGQRLRIFCYAAGVPVHGDGWWARVRVRPDEFVPTTFLQSSGRYSSIAPPISRRC